ncbi:MAG: sensor histidine kinase [Eubacterium sp.]|nr:sensor histidine kinase [Eubacterium sp.]
MDDNSKAGEIVTAIDREKEAFDQFIDSKTYENKEILLKSAKETENAINSEQFDYLHLGENRYAQLFSIRTSYGEYSKYRDQLINSNMESPAYINTLYSLYSMQEYLQSYGHRYVDLTLKESNGRYKKLIPTVYAVPIIAITMSILLLSVILEISQMMNKSITEPVLKLASASRRIAANDFYIDDVESDSKDELGELVSAFNKMKYATQEYIDALEKRREAIEKLHVQEVEKLEVEKQLEAMNLELLKNQVNPHFLFNTLNVIGGMANLEGAETTEQMINSLSFIFRYNLKNQEKEVFLFQELKVASDYMYLQKMRFGDRVKYIPNCLVEDDKVLVPTFTLQPLIENSIIHGISPKVEGGSVYVDVSKKDDKLYITVKDTGVGMDDDMVTRIQDSLDGKGDHSVGIGLGNIYRRLKTMYADAKMVIDNKLGEGTSVTIILPFRDPDKNYNKEND